MAHSNNQPQYANLIPEEEEQNEGSSGYTSQEESKSCREDNPDFERDDQHMYPSLVDAQDYSETKPVIDIMATDHTNSELLDPKLVQDQTILILELRNITGKITWNNDKRIYVKDDEDAIQICEFSVTDPLSWKDPDRRKFLNDRYGSQSAEDLLSRTLQNEFALSALRFYMKQVGLGAEYEFFVHYREVKEKPLNMCKCSCMQNYDDKDLVNVFFGIEGERFLHVDTATRKQIYQNQPNKRSSDGPMKRVYDQIYKYIEETLFPQFLRSCSRYVLPALEEIQHHKQKTQSRRQKPGGNMLKRFITFVANAFKQLTSGSSEQSVRADNNFIFLSFDFAGEDYPIQIEFHDRKRKREESKEIEETGLNTLGLKISPVNLTMTSQAAVDIFNWVKTGDSVEIFDQPALKTTLKNAINETSEGIKMVFEFKKHSEKRPEQLYNIIMDQKKQMREIDFNIAIWSLKLTLLDDVHSTSFVEFPRTSIEINGVEISNPKQNDNEDVAQGFKPRHSIERDIKFYQNLHLYIEYVSIKNDIRPIQNPPPRTPDTQSVEILRTQLQMRHRKCIISNHPYIPDEIIDINIPFLNINVRPSLLQLILYLDTLNLLNTDNGPEGDKTDRQVNERREGLLGVEKQNQVDTRAVADEKIVKDELKKFNREHKKNMARCRHCLIFNQKIRKMIYFALGRTNPNSNMINGGKPGLNMSWYQTQTQDPRQPLFTLQLPLLAMIKHERCFSGDLSIFMREFSTRHASGEDFLILPCKTSMSQYPDIHYKAWQACPLFTEALNLDDCNEHQSVLFQFLTLREAYYRNYWNELPMPKCLRPSPRTHDKLEVNVGAIQLLMNKSIHESNLIMAIIGSTELISMYEKLRTQPKKVAGSQSKTESPLQVSVNVDQIEILVDNGEHSFYADLHSFQLEKLPHKRTGGRNEVSSYETLNVKADYIALNQGTLLFGMIRNFVLNIESYATMQRGTLTVKSLDLKTDTEEQGRENVLLCPAFVEEDQTGDCVVPQIKQCPKQENFFTGILTMSPKNNDYNFKFEPIGISLHFQTMKLLFENFHSLINPGKLKSRLPVFRFDSLLNVAQIRSQAQLDHQLPLTVHIKAPMITLVARIAEKPLSTLCVTEFEFLQEKISPPPPPPPQPKDRPLLQLEQPPPPKDQMIIQARDIKYKPYGYLIHDILEKVEDLSNPIVKVKIDNVQNLIKVKSSNIRLFFANKIIEDLIGFITELIPKSEAPPSKNYSENEEKPATKTLICIKNVYILVPKGTMCRDMLTAHVDNAIIEISDAVLKFKTPSNIDKRVIPWKSKNIIWDSEITEVFFNTTQVDINLHGIGAWLMLQKGGKIDIGRVGKTQITVQAPGDKAELQKFKWNLDTKIDVVISKVNLWTSLGRLTQIDQIVTANVDENSDYFDKVSKWEKTELNITTNEANVEIAKWLTLALSEQDMQHEISSVDVSNEEQVFPHIIEPKLNVKEESKQDAKKEQKQVHFQVSPSASSTRIQNIQKFPSESEAQKNIDNASGQQNPNHPNVKHPGLYVAMRAAKGPHQEQLSNINTAQELSQIIQMEEQVRTLEDQYRNNEDPVRSVQMDILQELYAIRECLASPEETLTSELQQLKDENTKLKYRIEHLKRHIN